MDELARRPFPFLVPDDVISVAELREILLDLVADPSERLVNRLAWRDDMENYTTVKWRAETANDVAQYVNSIGAYEGNYVLAITNAVANPAVLVTFGCLSAQLAAVDLWWRKETGGGEGVSGQGLLLRNTLPSGGSGYQGTIKWRDSLTAYYGTGAGWTYVDTSAVERAIDGGAENVYDKTWNWLRVTFDLENNIYKRLQTLCLDIDLSSFSLQAISGYPDDLCSIYLLGYPYNLGRAAYFDDVRLYLNMEE